MKIIIPVAGIGKRLRPHTLRAPKVLLTVAGKPILGHILDKLVSSLGSGQMPRTHPGCGNEVIFIVSAFPEEIKKYVAKNYGFPAKYVIQKEQLGLGHAIWLTRKFINSSSWIMNQEPVLIVYGDTIFSADLQKAINQASSGQMPRTHPGASNSGQGTRTYPGVDGCIGVKSVADPRRFGIVELEEGKAQRHRGTKAQRGKGSFVKRFIEKPEHPTSNLAIVGVNYIRNTSLLFDCLEQLIATKKTTRGEYQLTDAFQLMVERKAKFTTFPIKDWFDCGTVSAMLDTNRILLGRLEDSKIRRLEDSKINKPVYIHPGAKIENSIIGPYVSIDKDVCIRNSIINNSLIYTDAKIENEILIDSIIGVNVKIKGTLKSMNK